VSFADAPVPTIVTRRSCESRVTSVATASSRPIMRVICESAVLFGVVEGTGGVGAARDASFPSHRGHEIIATPRNSDDITIAALAVTAGRGAMRLPGS